MNTKYGITLSAPPPAYASLVEALAKNKTWKVLHIIGSNVSCLQKKRLSSAWSFVEEARFRMARHELYVPDVVSVGASAVRSVPS